MFALLIRIVFAAFFITMVYKILNFGFPIYLLLFEIGIRATFIKDESTPTIIGPALASAGLSFLVTTLSNSTMPLDSEFVKAARQELVAQGKADTDFAVVSQKTVISRDTAWAFLILGILGWCFVCVKTIAPGQNDGLLVHPTLWGGIIYAIGVGVPKPSNK